MPPRQPIPTIVPLVIIPAVGVAGQTIHINFQNGTIDYYGNKKLLQSVITKCYDKILVSPIIDDSLLKVFIISDKLTKTNGDLYLSLKNVMTGETVYYRELKIEIPENSSAVYFQMELNSLTGNNNKDELKLDCSFNDTEKTEQYKNNFIFVKPNDYKGSLNFD